MKRSSFTRRSFLAGTLVSMPLARSLSAFTPEITKNSRTQAAFDLRKQAALTQSERPIAAMIANGDENSLPNRIACFVKGLPQNQFGEVDPAAYNALLAAIKSGKHTDFERIPRGGGRKLNNPQSAFTFLNGFGCIHAVPTF